MVDQYETQDYQNRQGRYPKTGVPDTVSVNFSGVSGNVFVDFDSKGTVSDAKSWAKKHFNGCKITSSDVGDYEGDWASTSVLLRNMYTDNILNEQTTKKLVELFEELYAYLRSVLVTRNLSSLSLYEKDGLVYLEDTVVEYSNVDSLTVRCKIDLKKCTCEIFKKYEGEGNLDAAIVYKYVVEIIAKLSSLVPKPVKRVSIGVLLNKVTIGHIFSSDEEKGSYDILLTKH